MVSLSYAVLLFGFLYQETRFLINIVHPNFLDYEIHLLEVKVFGTHPTLFLEKFISVPLSEVLMLCHLSYYALLIITGLVLLHQRKPCPFADLVFASAAAYYISFFSLIIYPVERPRYALANP